MFKDYYMILGVVANDSQRKLKSIEVNRCNFIQIKSDKNVALLMQDINEAYAILKMR